ncbi:putative transporter svop-1 [Bolinopsis microptera]|uniref:putative transporter svop-1 n=1 Tax=Bolinopsis microptera TaxID=2820187 RepID=UPI0030790E22
MSSENQDQRTKILQDEKRKLREDFDKEAEEIELDINEAMDGSTCGWGTLLYTIGTFFFCALEGAEIVLLTIIGPILRCEWNLSSAALSGLQISTMITMLITPLVTSTFGDRFGRKRISLISAVGVTAAAILCAFVQNYWQFIVLRLITGVFVGLGTGPTVTLSGEVTPNKFRALAFSGLSLPWGIGASVTGCMAYLILNDFGWRGLVISTSLAFSPCIVFFAVIRESARFQYYRGNVTEAEITIRKIYKMNGKGDVKFRLKRAPPVEVHDLNISCSMVYRLLQQTENISNSVLLLLSGLTSVFSYYISTYTMPRVLNEGYCTGALVPAERTCLFDNATLFDISIVSLSEPLGVILMLLAIEKFGRIKPAIGVGLLAVLLPTTLYFCVNRSWLFWFLLLQRMAIAAAALLSPILIAEYSPTVIRSFMISVLVTANRTGGIIGILCSEFLFNEGVRLVFVAIQATNLLFVFCLMGLKRETVGVELT